MKAHINKDKKSQTCFLCGHVMNYKLTGYDFYYRTTDKGYPVYECSSCELLQLIPVPSFEQILSFYPKDYYSYTSIDKEDSKGFFTKIREKIIEISYNSAPKKDIFYYLALLTKPFFFGLPLKTSGMKKFLDVGCGDGKNLLIMDKYGWNCSGFEVGEPKKNGNIFYNKHINLASFSPTTIEFDYIRMNHVLEHVTDPNGYLQTINHLLSNDGHFAISVPNTRSINAWLFGKFWCGLDVPRHVINYNPANLKKIFQNNGFEIKDLKHQQAGTFLLSLQFLINGKFNLNLNLIENPLFFLLCFPVDILFNFMRCGDVISGLAVKQ